MMLSDMLDFCTGMLLSVAEFLGSEPIIYLVGFTFMAFAVKVLRGFTKF